MGVDYAWFEDQVKRYSNIRPQFVRLADLLQQVLATAARDIAPAAVVQARAKTIPSFADKILRKQAKYRDPVCQLTDLCGVRVVAHTRREVERIGQFIRSHFEVDEANSEDTVLRLASTEFGYRSIHNVVQLKPNVFPTDSIPVGVPDDLFPTSEQPFKVEIQVRTIAQHAWADIGHDRLYKGGLRIPEAWRREAARIAALLESADDSFGQLVERVDAYRTNYEAYLDRRQMEEERERLLCVLPFDAGNEHLALQVARLAIALEDWDLAIRTVESFAARRTAALSTCLGFALSQKHKSQRHGTAYAAVRKHFDDALGQEPHHVEAVLHLADSWSGIDEDRSLDLYEQAFRLSHEDPRTLAAFLVPKIARDRNLSVVSLLRPSLEAAVERCVQQADVGVNLPWAWYWRALFHLLLERPYEAMDDVCRAVRLSTAEFMLDRALESVDQLSAVRDALTALGWARRLLLLAKAARCPQPVVDTRLSELATRPPVTFDEPVTIVAGACDEALEDRIRGYGGLLNQAFATFRGTVISGGTTAGVSGLVGDIAESSAGRIKTIGYLPRSVPAHAMVDRRYGQLLTTAGTDFSALEPLQNWIDLVVAGIAPGQVKVLGINGGTIARFEYGLALTLGAQVGLVRDSGREAGRLEQEIEAGRIPGLVLLPNDRMTVRTFIAQGEPSTLSAEQSEAAARAIHDEYRRNQQGRFTKDPAMLDWDQLNPALKQSNLLQADHIQQKLTAIGMRAVLVEGRDPRLIEFTPDQVELLAEMEHARWNIERLSDGWLPGERDPDNKRSPYLVGWKDLPDNVKEWDRQTVRAIPAFLARIGMEVQPTQP